MGDGVDEDRRQRGVAQHDGGPPAEVRGLQQQSPPVQVDVPVDRVVGLQDGRAPAQHRRQRGEEFVGAAVQERAAAAGPVGLDAGPDVRPVRLDGGPVVAPQRPHEPVEGRRAAVGEGAQRMGHGPPAGAVGGQQGELAAEPAGVGRADRLEALVEPVDALGGRQEVGKIAAAGDQRREEPGLTAEPHPGFGSPFSEDDGAAPVP